MRRSRSSGGRQGRDPLSRLIVVILILIVGAATNWLREREKAPEPTSNRTTSGSDRRGDSGTDRKRPPQRDSGGRDGGAYTPPPPVTSARGTDNVGSFNIKWFGTSGQVDRDEDDIRAIAATIQATGAALLGLQEIGDEETMDRLIRHLPGWKYVLGTSGRGQRVAMLWDSSRASVGRAVEWPDINDELESSKGSLRAPLVAPARVGKFDFLFVSVHLKAMGDERSLRMRREQLRRLRKRLDEWVAENRDKDVIVVGDYNDVADSAAVAELIGKRRGSSGFINTGARLPDTAATYMSPSSRIDHIVVSSPYVSQEEWTGKVFTFPKPRGAERKAYEKGVSDHLPTWATFRTDRDNDP